MINCTSMKQITWVLVGIIIIILGYVIYKENQSLPPLPVDTATSTTAGQNTLQSTFLSADKNISFTYPSVITATEKNSTITLHHEINYAHVDACDFKGDGTNLTPTFTDFHLTMKAYNMNIASTAATVSPYIPAENYSGNTLKVNPGFIDAYNNGIWNGYVIYEGAEGCGQVTYYLPLSSTRTLVLQQMIIGEFSSVASEENKQKILAQPGVISPKQADQIFSDLIASMKAK